MLALLIGCLFALKMLELISPTPSSASNHWTFPAVLLCPPYLFSLCFVFVHHDCWFIWACFCPPCLSDFFVRSVGLLVRQSQDQFFGPRAFGPILFGPSFFHVFSRTGRAISEGKNSLAWSLFQTNCFCFPFPFSLAQVRPSYSLVCLCTYVLLHPRFAYKRLSVHYSLFCIRKHLLLYQFSDANLATF